MSPYSIPLCTIFPKWPGPGRSDVRPAVGGRERLQRGLDAGDRLVRAAGHEAEALLQSPDATRDADVEVLDTLLSSGSAPALRVVEVRVAPVDEHVVPIEDPEQLVGRRLRDLARRDHHPDDARRLELPG